LRGKQNMSIDDIELEHYIEKHKQHEKERTSTNDRNEYWRNK